MSIPLTEKDKTKLRFNVGDRVECYNGHDSWGAGNVRAIFHTDAAFAADMCVPYLVELDNGDRVLAPADDDNAIRAVTSVVKPIETMCEELPATTTPKTAADADACEPTPASDPTSRVDCVVELVGLKTQAALNGQRARTLGWSDERQRMGVQLDDGVRIAVRLANLKFLDDQQSATSKTAVAAGSGEGVFEAAAAFMGAKPGFVFKRGTRGLGYYQDGAADIGEQVQKLMAAAPSKDTPPASDRKGLGAEGEHAIPLISTRQSAIAQLNAMEEELPDASAATPLLPEHGQVEQAFHAYRSLARKLAASEAGGPDETLPWHGFDLEVLLLLLGIRPSVLICHNTKPAFVQKVVAEVFGPWLALDSSQAPQQLRKALVLRQVTHACTPMTADSGPCCFQHSWVLSATSHPHRAYVEAAFFPPSTLRFVPKIDPVLYALIGRALGYPSVCCGNEDVDIAYVSLEADDLTHMEEVGDKSVLLDFMVLGPHEIPGMLRHFAACRRSCGGLIEIGLAMGGRYIGWETLKSLVGRSDKQVVNAFDKLADQINRLNMEEEERGVHLV